MNTRNRHYYDTRLCDPIAAARTYSGGVDQRTHEWLVVQLRQFAQNDVLHVIEHVFVTPAAAGVAGRCQSRTQRMQAGNVGNQVHVNISEKGIEQLRCLHLLCTTLNSGKTFKTLPAHRK